MNEHASPSRVLTSGVCFTWAMSFQPPTSIVVHTNIPGKTGEMHSYSVKGLSSPAAKMGRVGEEGSVSGTGLAQRHHPWCEGKTWPWQPERLVWILCVFIPIHTLCIVCSTNSSSAYRVRNLVWWLTYHCFSKSPPLFSLEVTCHLNIVFRNCHHKNCLQAHHPRFSTNSVLINHSMFFLFLFPLLRTSLSGRCVCIWCQYQLQGLSHKLPSELSFNRSE